MQSESTLSLKAGRRAALPTFLLVLVATLSHFAVAQTATQIPPQVSNGTAKLVQPVSPTQMLRVVLGMERPHAAAEEQFLVDLHTKGTKDYRHFLKPEEWNARFGPSKADEQAVVDWAKSQGLTVTARFPHRLVVDLEGPVSVIEKAFNVKINNYQIGTSIRFSNDREPQITGSAAGLVHSIGGLNDIQRLQPAGHGLEPNMPIYSPGPVKGTMAAGHANGDHKKFLAALKASKDKKEKKGGPGITNGFYDPTDLYGSNAYDFNALYAQGHCCNPFGNAGGTPPVTSIAIAMAGSTNGNDFVGFQAQYPYLAYHYFTIPIDGNPPCCSQEGTLDFEWSMAMSNSFGAFTDTSSIFMYQGVNSNLSTFTDIWSHMLADGNARTMNVSYGCAEFSCYDNGTMDTDHGLFNQHLMGRAEFEAMTDERDKFFAVVGNSPATAAEGETRTQDARGSDRVQEVNSPAERLGDPTAGHFQPDLDNRILELLPIFGLVNDIGTGTNHLDLELLQDAVLVEVHRGIEAGLSSQGGQ